MTETLTACLERRGPLGQKTGKKKKRAVLRGVDPAYLADVHGLACVACLIDGLTQTSPTRAHHCYCGRFSSVKAGDLDAIPLCDDHHQGGLGSDKLAIHQDKAAWIERYGLDTDFIKATRRVVSGG